MALIGPVLDDRSFEQLRDELVKRIPVFAPEWTDHNESDPGIALLELFASLGESLLYRFNQVPDATKVAFLRLLGVRPRPAQLASTLLTLETERPDGVQVLRGREARAGAVVFETDDEVFAWPLEVHAVGKIAQVELDPNDPANAAEIRRREDAVARLPPAEQQKVKTAGRTFYTVKPVPADPMAAADLHVDVSTTVDRSLWVALLARTEQLRPAIGPTLATRTVFLGVALDEAVKPEPFDLVEPPPGTPGVARTALPASSLTADPPLVIWELWSGPVDERPNPAADPDFVPLQLLGDTSRGLTTTGVVKLALPELVPPLDPADQPAGDARTPPPLDDPKIAARVVAWLRVRRPADENDAIHGVRWVGVNAVAAVQARAAAPELLGTGTGDPGQTFRLSQRPVVAGSVRLEVEEVDGWRAWTEVDTFAVGGPQDRSFTVDLTAGLVQFGTRTRLPQIGERIRVVAYRHGGGAAGNLPAGSVTSLPGVASVKVTNVLPATGGADAADLTEALEQIPAQVHRRERAVAADDFQALALEVPGVARAETLPLLHPDTPTQPAAGVVSVLVFPAEDLLHPAAPTPDVALLRRVAAYLNPRRLVTTELYVIPPTYRPIAVSVGVRVREGYQADAVRRWVELILRQYLAPLPPYGPGGAGWPLGRTVHRAELEAVAVQVDGVEFLQDELRLARRDAAGAFVPVPREVTLQPWEVPELVAITVVVGPPLAPGAGYPPSTPGSGQDDPVHVPLPPDVC
jgi:predicted phage baseplate assembly protein